MSYLSSALEAALLRRNMRPSDLARATGIQNAALSRWINGQQVSISDEDLENIARALSDDPAEQAELLVARMKDVSRGPGTQLIRISVRDRPVLREEAPPYRVKLPPKLERAFAVLSEWAIEDTDVRDILISLANLREHGTPTTDN